jgi:hypothetical protein
VKNNDTRRRLSIFPRRRDDSWWANAKHNEVIIGGWVLRLMRRRILLVEIAGENTSLDLVLQILLC